MQISTDSSRQHIFNVTVTPRKPFYSQEWYKAVSDCFQASYSTYFLHEEMGKKDTVVTHLHIAVIAEHDCKKTAHDTLNTRVYRAIRSLAGYTPKRTLKIVEHEDLYPFGYDGKEGDSGRRFVRSPAVTDEMMEEGMRIYIAKGEDFKKDKAERLLRERMHSLAQRMIEFKNSPPSEDFISLEGMSNRKIFERMCAEEYEGTTFADYRFYKDNAGLISAFIDDINHEAFLEKRERKRKAQQEYTGSEAHARPVKIGSKQNKAAILGNMAAKPVVALKPCAHCGAATPGTCIRRDLCSTCTRRLV